MARMSSLRKLAVAAVAAAVAAGCSTLGAPPSKALSADPWLRPSQVPAPPDNAPTAERVALGQMLFFDPRLSGSNAMSCATCHNPARGWADGLPTAVGHGHKVLGRATPTILNTAYQPLQMWDGRKPTLEAQALGPIEAAGEMNLPLDEALKRLREVPGYVEAFDKAYPGAGITLDTLGKALASYERTVVSSPSAFDRWRLGDEQAIGPQAKRGFELFQGKAKCSLCHSGFNFSDNGFHNIGVRAGPEGDDDGRFAHRKIKVLKGAFKTPTLRDIALTAPYMHNGAYRTLGEVVDHYDRGGDDKRNLSPNMAPLNLSADEKLALVAFMKSLTGEPRAVVVPTLPLDDDTDRSAQLANRKP
jgi:cytochrome c peroxidase